MAEDIKKFPIPTREEFLAKIAGKELTYASEAWGVTLTYRRLNQRMKSEARKMATDDKGVLNNERLESAMILIGTINPKLKPEDLVALMELDGAESNKYAALIGGPANP